MAAETFIMSISQRISHQLAQASSVVLDVGDPAVGLLLAIARRFRLVLAQPLHLCGEGTKRGQQLLRLLRLLRLLLLLAGGGCGGS